MHKKLIIMKLKVLKDIDLFEAYCARIEADIHRCSKEKITTQGQCDIIEQMSVVA